MKQNIIIIGAGIVGLATAYNIVRVYPNLSVLIIEKEPDVAMHQTGHNSGVIHSGIYYKPRSLKAQNCRTGYARLIEFCDQYNVKYEICGKVIVAVDENEIPILDGIYNRGIENGLENLRIINKFELAEIEPYAAGIKAIHVPQTGIIDFTDVSLKLKEVLIENGVEFKFEEKVLNIVHTSSRVNVITNSGTFSAEKVISCAGLQSDRIAKLTEKNLELKIIPFRGEYYELKDSAKHLVKNLIYPVPDPEFPFLGVHFTRMIDGKVEAGPNAVFSFDREGYKKLSFNLKDTLDSVAFKGFLKIAKQYWKTGAGEFYRSFSKKAFVKALRKLIPEIAEDDLVPGNSGIRAQACSSDGKLLDDFYFVENSRVLHVCNAPSPAATSAFSIGESIASKLNLRNA
ncbi:MAG: L-2-hydroxyglutarate oxidase [Melioribacteraceae bacterium]|nr:L-2-hydroxyglutarate oxidase [Melioribacteraceae bacterium]